MAGKRITDKERLDYLHKSGAWALKFTMNGRWSVGYGPNQVVMTPERKDPRDAIDAAIMAERAYNRRERGER